MTLPEPYYQDKSTTIFVGDCRDILPHLEPVDLVLTDPPYGIGEADGKNVSRSLLAVSKDYGVASWDNEPIDDCLMRDVRNAGKWAIVFGGNYYEMPPSSCWLVWDKENGNTDFADCELAWTNLKKAVRMKRHQWHGMLRKNKEYRNHPTQKPLDLIRWCINQAPDDVQTILDPFAGSGTTGVAAKLEGRKAILIELEEKYCAIAATRLRQQVLAF